MRRTEKVFAVLSLVVPMWLIALLLPVSSTVPTCEPACAAVAGVSNCKSSGGSGECENTTSGCIHKPPAPSGHEIDTVRDDDPMQCKCPNSARLWLQWDRVRVYKCILHCKSYVFSDKQNHEPKYRYEEACPAQRDTTAPPE